MDIAGLPPEFKDQPVKLPTSIEELEPGEKLVVEIHKHPFGILSIYLAAIVGLFGATALTLFLLPQLFNEDQQAGALMVLLVGLVIAAALVGIGLLVATYVYRQSRLIITNKNVTQVIQRSLFSRKVSELSLSNVEDVNVDQHGIIATIFGYGILNVQTAGEIENFVFSYCPRPNYYGRIILAARQQYADELKEEA